VVGDIGDSNRVTEEFRDKVHSIQKELERLKQQKQKEKEKEKDRSKKEPEEPRSGVIQSRALDSISP
jgi:Sec-independent protein translocase protein TatA